MTVTPTRDSRPTVPALIKESPKNSVASLDLMDAQFESQVCGCGVKLLYIPGVREGFEPESSPK